MADNKNLGMGVMIQMLFGNGDSAEVFQAAIGKTITALSLTDDALHFVFDDGSRMKLEDAGQSCCEARYMRTDDDLAQYVGTKLLGAEIMDAPDAEEGYETHEVQFLHVRTDRGTFTMSSHNEHNGYYGGFAIVARKDEG